MVWRYNDHDLKRDADYLSAPIECLDQAEGSRLRCSLPHVQRTSNTGTSVVPYGVSEYRTRRGKPCSWCRSRMPTLGQVSQVTEKHSLCDLRDTLAQFVRSHRPIQQAP